MRHWLLPIAFVLPKASSAAQSPAITEADLRHRLYAFAHDSMAGRSHGSEEAVAAARYLASEAERIGLTPAGERGGWFQTLRFIRRRPVTTDTLRVGDWVLRRGPDYWTENSPRLDRSVQGAEAIFGGVLGDTQLGREQMRGRIVVVVSTDSNGYAIRGLNRGQYYGHASGIAVVIGSRPRTIPMGFRDQLPGIHERLFDSAATVFLVSAPVAEALLGKPLDGARVGDVGHRLRGDIRLITDTVPVQNVVAVLPGSDPAQRGQYVALGAHLDHLPPRALGPLDHDSVTTFNRAFRPLGAGSRFPLRPDSAALTAARRTLDSLRRERPPRPDSIFNGADDDGSGSVALLEIAEALVAGPRPRRSVLFVWHAAEERGMVGARRFTDAPTIPLDSLLAQVNVDMIGRGAALGHEPAPLYLIGPRRRSPALGELIRAVNAAQPEPFWIDDSFDAVGHPERRFCRSDHAMYARFGVPVAFFSTGFHPDYHQVTDEPQYILYESYAAVVRLIHEVVLRLANLEGRLALEGPRPDPAAPCSQ